MNRPDDRWSSATAYDAYIGRWSGLVAAEFLDWLALPAGGRWLDVGCGTGVLTQAVLDRCQPASVVGVEPSASFVADARWKVVDGRAAFRLGSAAATGLDAESVDAVVSGLVLNFVPDLPAALAEMRRVLAPGGVVAAYVWDYARGMQLLRSFWDAARSVDGEAAARDEAVRFPLASPGPLEAAFIAAGLGRVAGREIVVPTVFGSFDELWTPFLRGTGPAPAYLASLDETRRLELRDCLRERLPADTDGTIRLTARAWAIRGSRGT